MLTFEGLLLHRIQRQPSWSRRMTTSRLRALSLGGALRASCQTGTPPSSLVASEGRKHFENWFTPRCLEKALEKDTYECNRPRPRRISRTSTFEMDKIFKEIEQIVEHRFKTFNIL